MKNRVICSLLCLMPTFAYAGDWGDIAFDRCWHDRNLQHKIQRSECVFRELEKQRALMQQLYGDALRYAKKHDALALQSRLQEFNVATDDVAAIEKVANGPGSHEWQRAKRLESSQLAYQAYIEAEKSRILSYVPGNGGEDAAVQHELNLIQDRIGVLDVLKE